MNVLLLLILLLVPSLTFGQNPLVTPGQTTAKSARPTACVNPTTFVLESCGGSAGAGLTDAQLRATPVPISGTVTANQGGAPWSQNLTQLLGVAPAATNPFPSRLSTGTVFYDALTDTQLRATPVPISGTVTATGPLTDTQLRATPVPISGTVTVGVFPDNEPVNISQINGIVPLMGNGITGTGSQRVTIASDNTAFGVTANAGTNLNTSLLLTTTAHDAALGIAGTADTQVRTVQGIAGMTKLLVTPDSVALPANQSVNLAQVAGTATVNGGLVGSQAVGGTSANNTAITQNPNLIGCEALNISTQPVAATSGNLRRMLCSTEGALVVTPGLNRWSCFVQAVTATTQCQAAPAGGLRLYVLSVTLANQVATVQTLDIVFGTGANCVTGITALTHKWQMGTNATTTSPHNVNHTFLSPLVPTAANAICIRPTAVTAFGATLTGYTAP